MAIPLIIAAGAKMASILVPAIIVTHQIKTDSKNEKDIDAAKNRYEQVSKEYGLDSLDDKEIARDLYRQGKITEKEYEDIVKLVDEYDNSGSWWKRALMRTDNKDREILTKYYNLLSDEIPGLRETVYNTFTDLTEDERRALFGTPTLEQLAEPQYMDVNFEGYQREVEPVKLWTGQELADLHNLNFDPTHYYDLIKAGTEADLAAARYTSEQLNNASMVDDTENVASYLDTIRNAKAEALSTGTTLGQRAANELLANQETLGAYTQNQAAVADARFQAVDEALLADASAKVTARGYFNQLAKSLAEDSMVLYDNDSTRFAQDMLSNAEFYRADQQLRGSRLLANANMYADWLQGNAQIAAYQKQLDNVGNEYMWLYENALRATGDPVRAKADVDDYITYRYTKYNTPHEMYADK